MEKSFRAAVLRATNEPLSVENVQIRALGPGDVLVKMRATSICHTDLEVMTGQLRYPLPMVLGHEGAGIIEAVGEGVQSPRVGEQVVLSWNPHCGQCFYCEDGHPILCEQFATNQPKGFHFDGQPRLWSDDDPIANLMYLGTFAEYCVVPAQSAVPVSADIPSDRACLIGCGVMTGVGGAKNIAKVKWGSSVMVLGCGAIGLSAIQGARLCGAKTIVAVDVDPEKLALAKAVGATHTCDGSQTDPVEMAREITSGRGADVVLECAGRAEAFRTSVEGVRPGGQVVWLGKVDVNDEVGFRWGSLMGERNIVRSSYGGARPHRDFPEIADAYLRGDLQLDEMVTARIALDDINAGFDALRAGKAVRTVIEFPA